MFHPSANSGFGANLLAIRAVADHEFTLVTGPNTMIKTKIALAALLACFALAPASAAAKPAKSKAKSTKVVKKSTKARKALATVPGRQKPAKAAWIAACPR
jgi:hypothetical protein